MSRLLKFDEIKYISKFILDHFNFIEFQAFLIQRTEINYYNHMPPMAGFNTGIPLFIDEMSKNYKIPVILLALESKFPDEAKLKQIVLDLGLSYQSYNQTPDNNLNDTTALQNLLNSEQWFDTDTFFNRLGEKKRCVCRVEKMKENGAIATGTGFLISPNQVLTNYHVIKSVLDKPNLLHQTKFRFDFEAQEDATELNSGSLYEIDNVNPIELYSEYCKYDFEGEEDLSLECNPDKLDFVILNLKEDVGNLSFGINANNEVNGVERGWIKLQKTDTDKLMNSRSLIIIQHPEKNPLKMAIGLDKIIGVSPNRRRIRYNINTLHGSSGSPVFNTNFDLVALHNMGDPSYIPKFNQGIIVNRIVEYLTSKNYVIQ